jgi:hypothetical protein
LCEQSGFSEAKKLPWMPVRFPMFSFYIHNLIEAKRWHGYKHKVGFRADLPVSAATKKTSRKAC